ncbi:putative DNA-binding protein with PD1-like motif [Inquilinus ginsengisoli]|jgi:predicted DNA-binding protein with PD1-like motif|uniref:PPC domain-containing DNA-binding protein n=1 Tax=Inquilinus ginsengisoli TaxID=363840 RepID=UPI003D244CAC
MIVKQLHAADGQRVFAVILETGEAVMESLQRFAEAERLTAAQITGIGAFSEAGLRYFDWERKEYLPIPVKEQVEVASLLGDVAVSPEGKPALHVHLVLGRRDGTALAGHLAEARVRPTLELIVTESPAHLRKALDPESGLALIRA